MRIFNMILVIIFMALLMNECLATTVVCDYNFGNDQIIETVDSTTTTINKKYNILKNNEFLNVEYTIKNISNFNELDDYITMSNEKGHRITYSLKCFKK